MSRPRLKPLPKKFINQYIVDMLNEKGIKYTVEQNGSQNQYKLYVPVEQNFEEIADYISSLVGVKFNRYIYNKLEHPAHFHRPLSILRFSADEKQRIIIFNVNKEA